MSSSRYDRATNALLSGGVWLFIAAAVAFVVGWSTIGFLLVALVGLAAAAAVMCAALARRADGELVGEPVVGVVVPLSLVADNAPVTAGQRG